MKKLILGLVAATAVAAPFAIAGSASAAVVSSAPNCVPVQAAPAVTHLAYKYKPPVNGSASTYWSKVNAATLTVGGIAYTVTGVTRMTVGIPAVLGAITCAATPPRLEAR